ncbi:MAG: ABC transporter permease [Promethearchaeota archaeon]
MVTGTLDESKRIVENSKYDAFIIQGNRDNIMEGGRVSDNVYNATIKLRGVKDIDKIIDEWITVKLGDKDTDVAIIGYDIESEYLEPWDIIKGNKDDLKSDYMVFVDQIIKKYFPDIKINDKLKSGEPEISLKVRGFTQNAQRFGNAMMWTNLETAQNLLHIENESTYLGVKLNNGYSVSDLEEDLGIFKDEISIISSEEMKEKIDNYLLVEYGIAQSIGILAVMGFIVSMIVISITLYQSVTEKLRELVSLKALGANKSFIDKILIGQTFLIITVSFILATLLALMLSPYISSASALPMNVNWLWALSVYIITLILGTLCSLFPIRKVHKTDPAIIFRA